MFLKYLNKITNNSSFRLVVLYASLYISSSLVLLGFIYWTTTAYIFKQMDHHIEYDRQTLMQIYNQYGEEKLIESIDERLKREIFDSIYLLYHTKKGVLAGNLGMVPEDISGYGWFRINLDKCFCQISKHSKEAQVLVEPLNHKNSSSDDGELVFLNGLDIQMVHQQQSLILRSMGAGVFIILVLGIFGGFIITRKTIRKIELINSTILDINEGDLDLRVPLRGTDDDYDLLSYNINQMLDQINVLVENIKNISNHVSHDLRTPLTRIRAKLENVLPDVSEKHVEPILGAMEEADNLLSAFNAILRISKMESGANPGLFSEFSITELLQDVGEFYEPLASEKNISLTIKNQQSIAIIGDRDMLFQALANVVDNAIKYSNNGGYIHLWVRNEKQNIVVSISDNGNGIPDSEKEKVFARFYQLSKHRGEKGHGLGLSLVVAIVELHRGHINLKDNYPGLIFELVFSK
ncbi:MAG: HAMP domain-containing sensor histidine kinase [Pseudomonadota bacterium]